MKKNKELIFAIVNSILALIAFAFFWYMLFEVGFK